MAPTEGRRRPDKAKSKAAKQKRNKEASRNTTVHDLPDHVFEQILLRLGRSNPGLVRCAATCTRWCRVVADAGFLARLAATGTPHVGDYHAAVDGCDLFAPSRPLDVDDSRFSLHFLPDCASWEVTDSRGSLLLLSKKCSCRDAGQHRYYCRGCPDLVVCDPLMKRHQGILWPPDLNGRNRMGVFLADGASGRVTMSNFRIIAVVKEALVSVFTTGSDGGWRIVHSDLPDDPETITADFFAGRANGSLYWGVQEDATMVLVLDEATGVFSSARLPENVWELSDEDSARLVGGEDGLLRAVRLIGNDLNVFARTNHPGCSNKGDEWVLEKHLGLPEATAGLPGHDVGLFQQETIIIAANAKYILLSSSDQTWVFSVELDTMRAEAGNYTGGKVHPYELPWPPVLPDITTKGRRNCRR